ncbi:hypothetical protein [Sandaracinus amylolyticus]|uniref:hypothetical protein n=1 Tax=Sandaracinus amylolyticus TaxID=927083 RepID=UPI001F3FC64A|nr:hypothetical protein [Sandaracinus amylolyticus]UJR82380.1 Hypothetical protein I5071_44450 [Sandaracinus amylolyticus]
MLTPCESCHRHVRASEAQCPFCGAAIEPITIDATTREVVITSRAQLVSFRAKAGAVAIATAIVGLAGCETLAPVPLYGGPPRDAGSDAGVDAGAVAPAYGAAPAD